MYILKIILIVGMNSDESRLCEINDSCGEISGEVIFGIFVKDFVIWSESYIIVCELIVREEIRLGVVFLRWFLLLNDFFEINWFGS